MHGLELGEISGQGDEMHRRTLVKLQELRIFVGISLPSQSQQFLVEIGVGIDDLACGEIHQNFALGGAHFDSVNGLRHGVGHQSSHPVLENPHARHNSFVTLSLSLSDADADADTDTDTDRQLLSSRVDEPTPRVESRHL